MLVARLRNSSSKGLGRIECQASNFASSFMQFHRMRKSKSVHWDPFQPHFRWSLMGATGNNREQPRATESNTKKYNHENELMPLIAYIMRYRPLCRSCVRQAEGSSLSPLESMEAWKARAVHPWLLQDSPTADGRPGAEPLLFNIAFLKWC